MEIPNETWRKLVERKNEVSREVGTIVTECAGRGQHWCSLFLTLDPTCREFRRRMYKFKAEAIRPGH